MGTIVKINEKMRRGKCDVIVTRVKMGRNSKNTMCNDSLYHNNSVVISQYHR